MPGTAPSGIDFPTSDDPVVRMGYRSRDNYWFDGIGIGQENADIFIPLSLKHVLFIEVGRKNKSRQIDTVFSHLLFEAIIRHASRYVFASSDNKGMHALNPRKVDPVLFKAEQEAWDNWHQSQCDAEREWDSENKTQITEDQLDDDR